MNQFKPILSLLLIVLLLWNLLGWWVYPVSIALFSHNDNTLSCCNGADLCCCISAGADACYCIPSDIHNESEESDNAIVCGISSSDDRNHSDDNGTFTFLDIRAFLKTNSNYPPFLQSKRKLSVSITYPSSTFLSDILIPPEFGQGFLL